MTDVTTALDAIAALTGERTKYEGWLAALGTKADVPAHVVERVRSDYIGRLRSVLQGFTAHVPALEATLGELQSRDMKLAEREQLGRDEHAEGELRHMVGEFDEGQWGEMRAKHEALLSSLSQDRRAVATELVGVQRALGAAGEAAQRARSIGESGTAPVSSAAASAPPAQSQASPSNTPIAAAAVVASAAPMAPVDTSNGKPAATYRPSAPASSAPPSSVVEKRESVADELGFLRGPLNTPAPDVGAQAASHSGARGYGDAPTLRIVADTPPTTRTVTPPSTQTATPGGSPVTADAAKTLKCAECGTMNYPTEWYCERCGGELAVL